MPKERKTAMQELAGTQGSANAVIQMMRRGEDLAGLVTNQMLETADDVVESSGSGALMRRVALAIEKEVAAADLGNREPVIARALEGVKVPMEVYLDMSTHPDFLAISHQVNMAMTVIPRRAGYIRAQTLAALAGDTTAAKFCEQLLSSGDKTAEETIRALESQGDDAVTREAGNILLELREMIDAAEKAEAPEDVIAEAQADVAVQHGAPERQVRLNLAEWSGES